MKTPHLSALLLALSLLTLAHDAPAAANDSFADAWVIDTLPYVTNASNVDATRQAAEPYHYGSTNGHSIWWTWMATSSGPMQANSQGSPNRSVIAVYTGAAVDNLTLMASGRGNHLVNFAAVAGTTYHIALDSLDAGSFGTFTFRLLNGVPPPANDAFANATTITGHSYSLTNFSNVGATKEPAEPPHAGDLGGKSVWWRWIAPASGTCQLATTGSVLDTLLAVYTGSSVSGLSLVASNDNYNGSSSLVTFGAVAGTEYHFAVDGTAGREGLINLALSLPTTELIFNGDFEAGNTGFSNDYSYSPGDMTPAGVYCVVSNPGSVHGSWASFGDHTTGSGVMLVANGDQSPTNAVWRQTVSVATNTVYLFSGWAASAYPANPGRFFLFVNGVAQGNVVELPSITGLWQNYSVLWESGAAATALLEARMLSTEYMGNDFVLDDLSFRRVAASAEPVRLYISKIASDAVDLSWQSVTNQLYQLQWAPSLATNQWFSLESIRPGTGEAIHITNVIGTDLCRFFRVIPVN